MTPTPLSVYEFSCGIFDMLEGFPGKPMIQIHATLDDVGTCGNDGMRAVVGYVAYSETWRKFNGRWIFTATQLGKESVHVAHDLKSFPLIGGMDDEAARLILAPFIEAVKGTLLAEGAVPICVITECGGYDALSKKEKMFVRPPAEHSFEEAVALALHVLRSPMMIDDAVSIQMDESGDSPRLYEAYWWLKTHNTEAKEHLGGICFLDDKRHPPIQAVDMLGNAVVKTWRTLRAGSESPRIIRELTFAGETPKLRLLHSMLLS